MTREPTEEMLLPPKEVLDALNKLFDMVGVTTKVPVVLAYDVWNITRAALKAALSRTPEEVEPVAFNGNELWGIMFGVLEGAVPEELTDERLARIAAEISATWLASAPSRRSLAMADDLKERLRERVASPLDRPGADQALMLEAADRLMQVEGALLPFAAIALDASLSGHPDSYAPRPSRGRPNMGHYRAALAALASKESS